MKRKHLLLTLSLIVTNCFAQDYFVDFENDTIKCKIIELKKGKLKFIIDSKIYIERVTNNEVDDDIYSDSSPIESPIKPNNLILNIDNLKHIYFSDKSVIDNPNNIKIEEPEEGFAHVYFFRPYTYLNSVLSCKVKYKGEKLFNLKTNGYFLHKIKAGELHKYYRSRLGKDNVIEINAKNKKVYFVRGVLGYLDSIHTSKYKNLNKKSLTMQEQRSLLFENSETSRNGFKSSNTHMIMSGERNIVMDYTENAKYYLLNMKKKLKAY